MKGVPRASNAEIARSDPAVSRLRPERTFVRPARAALRVGLVRLALLLDLPVPRADLLDRQDPQGVRVTRPKDGAAPDYFVPITITITWTVGDSVVVESNPELNIWEIRAVLERASIDVANEEDDALDEEDADD